MKHIIDLLLTIFCDYHKTKQVAKWTALQANSPAPQLNCLKTKFLILKIKTSFQAFAGPELGYTREYNGQLK